MKPCMKTKKALGKNEILKKHKILIKIPSPVNQGWYFFLGKSQAGKESL